MNEMIRIIVTADIHGSYSSWLQVKGLLGPGDGLLVAGDLFDTKYGNYSSADFQPESIKKDLASFKHPFYYVYGNCDVPSFFPGYDMDLTVTAFQKEIFLCHGHQRPALSDHIDIFIQGHTHICALEKRQSQIFMNPGSVTYPRNGILAYGVIEKNSVLLIDLNSGEYLGREELI